MGPKTDFKCTLTFTLVSPASASFLVSLPAAAVGLNQLVTSLAVQGGANVATVALINGGFSTLNVTLAAGGNFAVGFTTLYVSGSYRTA